MLESSKNRKAQSKVCKLNKVWVDQCGEFYNTLFKWFLKINNIEVYLTHDKGKFVVAVVDLLELWKTRFLSIWQVVKKYNNAVHRTFKMKPVDVTSDSYAEYNEDSNEKDSKFKVGDYVRISKYKNIFAKGYTENWSEVFVVIKIKNTVPWTYVICDLNG